ncbi:MAG: SDR family oxidoreductase [Promethearchaeota archaeon]
MRELDGKKVVVTGAAGFIGSHLVDELLKLGSTVVGLDNFYNGKRQNLASALLNPRFTLVRGDVRDYDLLLAEFEGADVVFHEAAFTSVPQSVRMPVLCNDVNVGGVVNVLNACRRRDVERLVFASSSSVYGDTPTLPKHEEMRRDPISPYGVSKLAGEQYLVAFHRVYGLNTTALRYFNVFGPRQKDSPYSGVIAIFMGAIFRDEPLVIFGDGTQSRDFTYVKDVVTANLLAATHPEAPGQIFNAAAGGNITLTELAKEMLKIAGKDLPIKYADPRPGDILHSFGDISKIRNVLGFEPKYDVISGLRDYYQEVLKDRSLL